MSFLDYGIRGWFLFMSLPFKAKYWNQFCFFSRCSLRIPFRRIHSLPVSESGTDVLHTLKDFSMVLVEYLLIFWLHQQLLGCSVSKLQFANSPSHSIYCEISLLWLHHWCTGAFWPLYQAVSRGFLHRVCRICTQKLFQSFINPFSAGNVLVIHNPELCLPVL